MLEGHQASSSDLSFDMVRTGKLPPHGVERCIDHMLKLALLEASAQRRVVEECKRGLVTSERPCMEVCASSFSKSYCL